jgi:hypothetical protein
MIFAPQAGLLTGLGHASVEAQCAAPGSLTHKQSVA